MSSSTRTLQDAKKTILSRRECEPKEFSTFYDNWATNYEKDLEIMNCQAQSLVADQICSHFSGSREEARVLDVACGPGQFAKIMSELGFKHFVGVDFSKGMLEEAAKTGQYEDLKQVKVGAEPLPVQAGTFDVVVIIGCLNPGLVPLSTLRELCHISKPGGLICLTKAHHTVDKDFDAVLEKELQLLEDAGLWTPVEIKTFDRFMRDASVKSVDVANDEHFISGTVYLFRKPLV